MPQGAIVLDNHNGTAPGLILEKDNKTAILLPGPPNELIPLFNEQVYPYLEKLRPEVIRSQMVKVCGIGESQVEDKLLNTPHQWADHRCFWNRERYRRLIPCLSV